MELTHVWAVCGLWLRIKCIAAHLAGVVGGVGVGGSGEFLVPGPACEVSSES